MLGVLYNLIMRHLGWAFAIVFVLISPNLIWLGTSTLRIQSLSNSPIDSVAYMACETIYPVGSLDSHQSIFRFLPTCGDDTLKILIGENEFCQTYIEGELYHVDAVLKDVDSVSCRYDDLLSSLFVVKALW